MGLLVAGQSNLDGATFLGADLSQAQLPEASAIASVAYGARFNIADLRGLHFQRTDVHGSDFRQAILDGADLSNSMAYGADFENARLLGAKLEGAYLEGSDFGSANLTKASLKEADLHGADLSNADCTGADFTGANLEGCDLSGTILKNAKNVRGRRFGWILVAVGALTTIPLALQLLSNNESFVRVAVWRAKEAYSKYDHRPVALRIELVHKVDDHLILMRLMTRE